MRGLALRPPMAAPFLALALAVCACGGGGGGSAAPPSPPPPPPPVSPTPPSPRPDQPGFFIGADLSYVTEIERPGCNAVYRLNGAAVDPYELLYSFGADTARFRLFHTPTATVHGSLAYVTSDIMRARGAGLNVMLDFHYSDNWADPGKQTIPAAWAQISDTNALADAVYDYTFDVLTGLDAQGLMPDFVQVGNEINTEILRPANTPGFPIDWARNAALINAGVRAVRDAGAGSLINPRVILHIAQPENVDFWFSAATANGVTDYDIIGVSYYPQFSTHSIGSAATVFAAARAKFGKDVMVVEAAYPWTLGFADSQNNILNANGLEPGFPATPAGQRDFMIALTQAVIDADGIGVIYWEPAWISTPCPTQFGPGSAWENATLFDFNNGAAAHAGIAFLSHPYQF